MSPRIAAAGLLTAFLLVLGLSSAMVSPLAHHQAAFGEAPDHAPCFGPHHPCDAGAIAAVQGKPVRVGATAVARVNPPTDFAPAAVRDVAPATAIALSILFRNLRE